MQSFRDADDMLEGVSDPDGCKDNPQAVTNFGVGSKFLFVGQRRELKTGFIIHIAKKLSFPGVPNFYYLLCSSQHTVTYWRSAKQLKTMIEEEELQKIPQPLHPHAFPGVDKLAVPRGVHR